MNPPKPAGPAPGPGPSGPEASAAAAARPEAGETGVTGDSGPAGAVAGWWHRQRLSSRIVLVSMALLLIVQAAGFAVIRQSIDRSARSHLDERMDVGERVWSRMLEQRAGRLAQGAAVLAADYGLREALATRDLETMRSALHNHGTRLHASHVLLLDTAMALQATGSDDPGRADAALPPALQRLVQTLRPPAGATTPAVTTTTVLLDQQPHQFVLVPVRSPMLVGWVLMGFPVTAAMLADLRAVVDLEATLVLQPVLGEPRALDSSMSDGLQAQSLAHWPGDGEVTLAGETHLVRSVPLVSDRGGRITLRLSASMAGALAPYRGLQWLLALITVLGLVLFGAGSVWTARRVTRPLRGLVRASERMGAGRYDTPVTDTIRSRGDEIGELARAFDTMRRNISAHEAQVLQMAYWDRLTGLPNRAQFRELVGAAIDASLDAAPLSVVMLDLDRFKHVNDVLGYPMGDRLLSLVGGRLRDAVRQGDSVARLGGDEFAVLMPGAGIGDAQALARRLAAAFEMPLKLDDHLVDITAGVGIAAWPEHAADADTLLSRAEVAMYAAKRHTAGAQVYDPAFDSASATTLSLLSDLKRAIEQGELRLFLQPKIDIATGALGGAEALVRWQHPQRGMVPPMQFIPFAEQTGFIRELTLWVAEAAAAQQAALLALGVRRISINLSARDLMDQDLPDKLDAILARHHALAQAMCLELTESAIMDDPQRAEATLNRLAERGYKLSIDDFGTGYSSLAYLKRLPVHELKIDKSFVMGMASDSGDAKIVRSTIDLAHNLGLSVVAEGVESEDILALLHQLHCDEGQGYHMSRPLPADDFVAFAERWQARPPIVVDGPKAGQLLLH